MNHSCGVLLEISLTKRVSKKATKLAGQQTGERHMEGELTRAFGADSRMKQLQDTCMKG
jgi:hypothetical protein